MVVPRTKAACASDPEVVTNELRRALDSRNLKLIRMSLYGMAAVGRATPDSLEKKNGRGRFSLWTTLASSP